MVNKRQIILDVDTGTDDSIAIMLAVLSSKFEILGITTVWGNQAVEDTTKNTLRVLEFLNSNIKVFRGCSEPMVVNLDEKRAKNHIGNPIYYYDEKGKEHHLHPKRLPFRSLTRKEEKQNAVSFLINTLMNSKKKITLVLVGPCTNLAMAFRIEPRIKNQIKEIVFMGGSDGIGNVSKTAEANFWHDPEAVKIILQSQVRCTICSLNATQSVPLSIEDVKELEKIKTKASKKAAEIVRIRMDVSKHLGWSDGSLETVHDPLAIAYLLDPTVAVVKKQKSGTISCEGENDGTLSLEDNEKGNINFIYEADKDKYFQIWKDVFKNINI